MTSQWHPIFLTTEISPGVWEMQTKTDYGPWGRIELRRVDGGRRLRYKVTLSGGVLGWATTLQEASERLWRGYLERRASVYSGPPNGRR